MSSRRSVSTAILLVWVMALGLLGRRELFREEADITAQVALLVAPGVEYYAVTAGEKHVGFASSKIDTTATSIDVAEFFTAVTRSGGRSEQASARTAARLTRGFRLRSFVFEFGPSLGETKTTGELTADTLLTVVTANAIGTDTQTFVVRPPLLVPSVVPLAIALGSRPSVGKKYQFTVFDPTTKSPAVISVRISAESLFTVADSARYEPPKRSGKGGWVAAHADTVRAWRLVPSGAALVAGWVDDKGRFVESDDLFGFTIRRTAYEIARVTSREMAAHNTATQRQAIK